MSDWFIICYEDLTDNEKDFIRDICKIATKWKDKYEDEIKRLQNEIEWLQKQIDKIG